MKAVLEQLSQCPVRTRLSLTGTLVVARDIAHAKLDERIKSGLVRNTAGPALTLLFPTPDLAVPSHAAAAPLPHPATLPTQLLLLPPHFRACPTT